jgi:hypothetical protein
MAPLLFSLAAFPDVHSLALIAQNEHISIEVHDNYLKQTFRNRYRISSSIGATDLSIPVNFSQNNRAYSNVEIDYKNHWNRTHWRTITAAYNNSPYFTYYSDEYEALFMKGISSLMQFNLNALQLLCKHLGIKIPLQTQLWKKPDEADLFDFRFWIKPNTQQLMPNPEYTQVFADRHGFIPSCSALDLLFCLGPDAKFYLHSYQPQSNK